MENQGTLPLAGDRQEPQLSQAQHGQAKPHARSEPPTRQGDKIEQLCAEVYRLTGQKLTRDDPVLLAALFQSELIIKAGEHAAALFQDTVARSVAQLAETVKAEREQAASLDQSVASAFQHIADGAKKMGEQELATIQARFARAASDTLAQVRREAASQAPGGLWWKSAAILLFVLLAGLAAGFYCGRGQAAKLSDDQLRLMHNGLLLDEAWPRLPKAAREQFGVAPKAAGEPGAKTASKQGKSWPGP